MNKSHHFYETQTRNIMGKPPARVLYYSSIIMLVVFLITVLIARLVPFNITENISATVSYGKVASDTLETYSPFSSLDTLYGENSNLLKRKVVVNIRADDIQEYIPLIGDTITLYGINYVYDSPIVIDKKIVNSNGILIACEGTGVILSPSVILPEENITIQINRGVTNYLSRILNI